jgi:hypothetical protein
MQFLEIEQEAAVEVNRNRGQYGIFVPFTLPAFAAATHHRDRRSALRPAMLRPGLESMSVAGEAA